MANCSKNKNPLKNNGTSQAQRLLPAMDKNKFALVDEKEFADWIVFANNFSEFINYYKADNTVDGNWQPFFSSDISAQLGTIALQDIDRYRTEIQERFDFISTDDNSAALNSIEIKLNELFSVLLTLSKALDDYAVKLPDDAKLKVAIQNQITTKLAPALNRLLAYYKAASDHLFLDDSSLENWMILNRPLTNAAQIIDTDGLSSFWFDKAAFANWTVYKNAIGADESVFNNPLTEFADEYLSIEHAANHNLFTGIFDIYLASYAKIIGEAEKELLSTLENYDAHTPHYALFLCFLKLYRFTQKNVNSITQRHLDFYYKEVLRLQPRKAEANKVHVLVELAKQVDEYLLTAETGLKAGKDSLKKEVTYELENDTFFNKATVAELRTFYKAEALDTIKLPGSTTVKQNNAGRLFASPVANSEDGLGAKLTSANSEWHPFTHKIYKDAQLESIAMPKAEIGFAIASHYLFVAEGERVITVKFDVGANRTKLYNKSIACYITTEKGWLKIGEDASTEITPIGSGNMTKNNVACAQFAIELHGDAPATANYNAELHGGTYNVNVPMLKVILVHNDLLAYQFNDLKDIVVSSYELKVEVGNQSSYSQTGLKELMLSNDFGSVDSSKPFMPFGAQPKKDSTLVIGNKELFSKKNAKFNLNIEWANLPGSALDINYNPIYTYTVNGSTPPLYSFGINKNISPNYPTVKPQFLNGGIWENKVESTIINSVDIFNGTTPSVRVFSPLQAVSPKAITKYENEYEGYNSKSKRGLFRLKLDGDFGHKKYLADLTSYLTTKTQSNYYYKEVGVLPTEPYTPLIQSLYISYSAYTAIGISENNKTKFESRESNFFHINPFGEAEQHKYLSPSEPVYLLPQFKHEANGITQQHQGEFYIGLKDLKPESAVSLLFQVLEGTTNPKLAKPADHIHWSYLSKNRWVEFADSAMGDNTLQLVQSGIISFTIPADADLNNTVLPAGFIWLRASVSEAAEAVCKLLSVHAQATVAKFVNADNAPDFLDNALPATNIAKLKTPVTAVKKLEQPYPSFGGRAREDEDHFYIRVSERLRHKDRGITVWDYEHLVLEAFPEIYKVKCLNHTQVEDGVYNEVKPGYVSIITIPLLQYRNDTDPLKPYTQQSTLTRIEDFLRKRISCFVKLRACQPQFEEVRLEFSLKLHEAYLDFTLYANMLKEEITQFLSPWAYDQTSTIDFGGKIHKSVLINFIEERYYVDFITDVKMFVRIDDATNESGDLDEISASTARSILVSAPAAKHTINKITLVPASAKEECPGVLINPTANS